MNRDGNKVAANFHSDVPVTAAALHFTADTGPWQKRKWQTQPARIEGSRALAELPVARPLVYFLTVMDERKATVSTEHHGLDK
ncbi:MAG TPA: hypothetical protein VEL76_08355 [Gemmataceae bacterium]|nr:hypothetical protein [Gemmataceae bacterium]